VLQPGARQHDRVPGEHIAGDRRGRLAAVHALPARSPAVLADLQQGLQRFAHPRHIAQLRRELVDVEQARVCSQQHSEHRAGCRWDRHGREHMRTGVRMAICHDVCVLPKIAVNQAQRWPRTSRMVARRAAQRSEQQRQRVTHAASRPGGPGTVGGTRASPVRDMTVGALCTVTLGTAEHGLSPRTPLCGSSVGAVVGAAAQGSSGCAHCACGHRALAGGCG
jgi:hypothetical protein